MSESRYEGDETVEQLRSDKLRLERQVRQIRKLATEKEALFEQSKGTFVRNLAQVHAQSEELRAAKVSLEEALAAKDRFLAIMGHEIRTPMNGVIGNIDLLESVELGAEATGMVATLKESANTLMLLLDDVLDYARLGSNRLEIERAPFHLGEMLGLLQRMYSPKAAARDLTLDRCLDDSLPAWVEGDSVRLQQVLSNLVSNAVKFTETGGISMAAETDPTGEGIRFSVRDTGVGITSDQLVTVFEPFTQADDSITRRFGGTGLGLAISRSLVEAMGGELEVESAVDVGTTFSFVIDLPRAEDQPVATPQDVTKSAAAGGGRVLVVDDNPVNLLVARRMLQRLGHGVGSASGGAEAVDAAAGADWDVILMDCSMPEVDGFEATRRIRSLEGARSRATILALTAFAGPDDRERCLDAGMNGYLTKPLRLEELRAALVEWSVAGVDRPEAA